MSKLYKRLLGVVGVVFALALILSISGFFGVNKTEAQAGPSGPLRGWIWSSNVGWISVNSLDGGGGPYSVNMNSDGSLTGYAWSSGVGWIQFGNPNYRTMAPEAPLGTSADAKVPGGNTITSGNVTGWARACNGTSTGSCDTATPSVSGWNGWLALSGSNHSVTYNFNSTTGVGTFGGSAWSSDLGWLDFQKVATVPLVSGLSVSCQGTKTGVSQNMASWSATAVGGTGTYTTYTWSGTAVGTGNPVTSGPHTNAVTSFVTVTDSAGSQASGSCGLDFTQVSGSALQMWLNNDSRKLLSNIKTRVGRPVTINLAKADSTSYSSCQAYFGETLLTGITAGSIPQEPDNLTYSVSQSLLTVGTHKFSMSCIPSAGVDPVKAKTNDDSNTTVNESKEEMQIQVIDPELDNT